MIVNILFNIIIAGIIFIAFKKHRLFFFFFLPFAIQYLWMSVSLTVIENGTFISEQDRYGYFQYSNFFLFIFFCVSIMSFSLAFDFVKNKVKINVPKIIFFKTPNAKLIITISSLILFLGIFNMLTSYNIYNDPNKGQWPEEITKFNYWKQSAFPIIKSLTGNTMGYFPFILGIIFCYYKRTAIVFFVIYFFYLIGIGQKFGPIMYSSFAFFISVYTLTKEKTAFLNIITLKRALIFMILMLSLVYAKYFLNNPFEYLGYSPFESIMHRAFGLQGHVFWGTVDKYVVSPDFALSWDLTELKYGMHKLMEVFYPDHLLKFLPGVIERGVSWTNAYPAILLSIFPWPLAILTHLVLFIIVGFNAGIVYKLLIGHKYLWATVFFQTYLWLINAFVMAFFYRVQAPIIAIIFLSFFSKVFSKKRT